MGPDLGQEVSNCWIQSAAAAALVPSIILWEMLEIFYWGQSEGHCGLLRNSWQSRQLSLTDRYIQKTKHHLVIIFRQQCVLTGQVLVSSNYYNKRLKYKIHHSKVWLSQIQICLISRNTFQFVFQKIEVGIWSV